MDQLLVLAIVLSIMSHSSWGQLVSQSQAQTNCQNLFAAGTQVLQDMIGTGYSTSSGYTLKGYQGGGGPCKAKICAKLNHYSTIPSQLPYFLSKVVTGINGNGASKIKPFFGTADLNPPFYTTGGSGSGGGFQFHCGSQELGGCGGGGGGGFNMVNGQIIPEIGGGGGCNVPGAELNYGCHLNNGDNINVKTLSECAVESSSTSWASDLTSFQNKLKICAASGTLTVQGGGGGGGGSSNNQGWVGYGCSFYISVNNAPVITSGPTNYLTLGTVMSEAYTNAASQCSAGQGSYQACVCPKARQYLVNYFGINTPKWVPGMCYTTP